MSSSTLFRIAAGIFILLPLGHTKTTFDMINPGLKTLGDSDAANASKLGWNQANGYFITTGLLCLNWAERGVGALGWDRYIFGTLLVTHIVAGALYIRKGIMPPGVIFLTASALTGVAVLRS